MLIVHGAIKGIQQATVVIFHIQLKQNKWFPTQQLKHPRKATDTQQPSCQMHCTNTGYKSNVGMNLKELPVGTSGCSHCLCHSSAAPTGLAVYNMEPPGSTGKRGNHMMNWISLSVFGGGWEGSPWQKGISKALKEVSVK